jgi:hypothetical protein
MDLSEVPGTCSDKGRTRVRQTGERMVRQVPGRGMATWTGVRGRALVRSRGLRRTGRRRDRPSGAFAGPGCKNDSLRRLSARVAMP